MAKDMKMIIGGEFVNASDGASAKNVNPYTGELIGTVPAATQSDIDRAAAFAVEGQREWGALRGDEREAILERFLTLFEARSNEIAELLCAESGKSISECRGEMSIVKPILRAYMRAAATLYGETLPPRAEQRNRGDLIFTIYEPIGVCAAIAPFNYPISTMFNKVAPALCAGNSVIMKPASDTPMSILAAAELMLEAGMPANAIQVVTGSGSKVGGWLTKNKNISLISLTGSTEVGVALHREASSYLQRLGLELGGNDPLLIFADCDIDRAVEEAINGRIYNCGQICSGSKRFIVENGIKELFTEKLIERLKGIKGGVPSDEDSVYGCMINEAAADTVERQIKETVAQGARCVYGGGRPHRALVEPTVLTGVTADMDIAGDMEVFGPVFPIIGFDSFDEAISIANNTSFGLSSGVITENMRTAMAAAMKIKAGTCVINGTGDYRTSYHLFGGCKMSGLGREGALETLKEFSEVKSVVMKNIYCPG
ncbi:MAG: aldehyde dehydrogenase family protein [Synergistaceae bacterium]|nr:aldehyde dehydrogenase family protein [Synergistaceae bacterium]